MTEDWAPGERRQAILLAAVMLSAVLYPLRQHFVPTKERQDGFPLSYYPMFSAKRQDTVKVAYGVGIHADGSRHYLPQGVLGTGGANQVRRQVRKVVRENRVDAFAKAVAAGVSTRPSLKDVVRVEIVDGEFDIDACFLNHKIEGTEEILGGADVVRLAENQPLVAGTDMAGTDMVGMPL
jgi:hypothetical protein